MVALCEHHPKFRLLFNLLPPNRNPPLQTSHRLACVPWECCSCANGTSQSAFWVDRLMWRRASSWDNFDLGQFIFLSREAPKVLSRRGKLARPDCEHVTTVTIRNSGIERTVCETCGHVSFRGLQGLSGKASRSQFERASERASSMAG